jgi:hypothetical protein
MCDVIRLAKGLSSEEINLHRPFSIFHFLENRFHGDSLHSLHRIFSQLRRSKATRMVMEELPAVAEVADEISDLQGRLSNYVPGATVRLSFFRDAEFVGYAIVRTDLGQSHVFESVVPKYSHKHNFVPGQTEFSVRCGEKTYSIRGIMYCQQNQLNKVCAHVALRSLLVSALPQTPIYYSELNQIANVSELGKGLNSEQIRAIVQHYKIPFVDLDYENSEPSNAPYHRFIYAGMESGLGGLVGFQCTAGRHIIPFFVRASTQRLGGQRLPTGSSKTPQLPYRRLAPRYSVRRGSIRILPALRQLLSRLVPTSVLLQTPAPRHRLHQRRLESA